MVVEFSKAFNVRQYEMLSFVPDEVLKMRARLIIEEEKEYDEAVDHVGKLDALCDLLYVSLGAAWVTNTSVLEFAVPGPEKKSIKDCVSDVVDELQAPIPCQKVMPFAISALNKAILSYAIQEDYDFQEAFAEVHRSNMTKLWSPGQQIPAASSHFITEHSSKGWMIVKRADGKILKPPGWKAPNLTPFV